jgi:hypothetical protein
MNYLDYEVTQLPDSVEMIFCKPLDEDGVRKGLDETQQQIIIKLLQFSQSEIDEMYDDIKSQHGILSILEGRLVSINCKIDKASRILISLSCSTPGEAVMYTYYIAYMMKKKNISDLSLDRLFIDVFHAGFFSAESLYEYWSKQKVNQGKIQGGDNLLDYSKASESLLMK